MSNATASRHRAFLHLPYAGIGAWVTGVVVAELGVRVEACEDEAGNFHRVRELHDGDLQLAVDALEDVAAEKARGGP